MAKNLLEKNGWHIKIDRGGVPYWEEDVPQYTIHCWHCNGVGTTTNHGPDCIGLCFCESEKCPYCKDGKQRGAPLTPIPDDAIIDRLHSALAQTVLDFKVILDNGELEKDIAAEKAKADALASASL